MDLSSKTPDQLRTLLDNARAKLAKSPGHERAMRLAEACAIALARFGRAQKGDLAGLRWTPDLVDKDLAPFAEVARGVPGNQRTAHTRAGGQRRAGAVWIDTYSAIKANGLNYVFVCFVERPGDDPVFALLDESVGRSSPSWRDQIEHAEAKFTADRLDEALEAWRAIAAKARPSAQGNGGGSGGDGREP